MESVNRSRPREPALPQAPAQPRRAQSESVREDAASEVFSPPLPRSGPPRGLPGAVLRLGVSAACWSPLPPRASQPDRDRAPGS